MSIRSTLLALALVVLSAPLHAAILEGTDYQTLDPPQPTDTPGKIEVIEFFSYGCPHCYEFHPLISAWAAKLPKDVVFKRVATGLGRPAWTNLARMYYALQAIGALSRLDAQIFHAVHQEQLPLFDEPAITDWVVKHDVDREKFTQAFESFGVNTKIDQAEQMIENYKVEAVPTLAVAGKYVVIGNSFEQILSNTNAVIAKVRAERAAGSRK
jgi:protein dithiol oxidoreductase (disulfide-forming)